jgi:hypothetical protein
MGVIADVEDTAKGESRWAFVQLDLSGQSFKLENKTKNFETRILSNDNRTLLHLPAYHPNTQVTLIPAITSLLT